MVVHKPALPLVHMSVVFRTGSAADPSGKAGLASFTAAMMKTGTKTRSAAQIADEVETVGANLGIGVDEDSLTVSTSGLESNFDTLMGIVSDVLQNSTFAKGEMERVRKRRLAMLEEVQNDPGQAASRVFRRVLFGEHPYGHSVLGERSAIQAIGRKNLKSFYQSFIHPQNAAVLIVGSLTPEDAVNRVKSALGTWKRKGDLTPPPQAPSANDPSVVLVERKDAPQSQLRIGHLGVARTDPDYFALVMCNAILGGLFNSRINMNLRESKGYTYGARSRFDFMRGRGAFWVSTGVRTDVTDLAIREVLKEIQEITTDHHATQEELDSARNRYSLSLPGNFQTVGGVSSMMANLFLFDLPLDYYQTLPENLQAVTLDDVNRVAREHIRPEKLTIVVVGDSAQVADGLDKLKRGPVSVRDNDGKPLAKN
jgi:zinc protease